MHETLARHMEHYERTMGTIPDALADLAEASPEMFDGYSKLRRAYLRPDSEAALPLKYRHLILLTLDCMVHNLDGALNHLQAAMRAGLSADEVTDAMLAFFIVGGAPAWGEYGRHVVARARATEQGGVQNGA
jgi:alkylhydroperoxidase/carboxymuconolactone decarboxylase family protein YurZ